MSNKNSEFVLFNSVMLPNELTTKKIEALEKANIPFRVEKRHNKSFNEDYVLVYIKNEHKRQANKSQKGLYLFSK